MAARPERRGDPRTLWPEVRAIVMLGVNYGPAAIRWRSSRRRDRGAISVYAQGDDYHDVIKKRLKALARWLDRPGRRRRESFRRYRGRDGKAARRRSRPRLAGQAHQPGVAPNSAPGCSSARCSPRSNCRRTPPRRITAARCRACLDICPTAAFPAPYRLDARRCISYLTIEHKGPIPRDLRPLMGNRIYGCDDCLAVCPWNKFAQRGPRGEARRRARRSNAPALADLARLDDAGFRKLFAKTAIKRTGRDRFVRNVLIAIGNSGDPALAVHAERLLDGPLRGRPRRRRVGVGAAGSCAIALAATGGAIRVRRTRPDGAGRMGRREGSARDHAGLPRLRLFGAALRRAPRQALRPHRRHHAQRGMRQRLRHGGSAAARSRCWCSTATPLRRRLPRPSRTRPCCSISIAPDRRRRSRAGALRDAIAAAPRLACDRLSLDHRGLRQS